MHRRQFIKFMAAGTVAAVLPISIFGKFIPKDGLDLNKIFKGPFYLYEVPGKKIGVTTDIKRRFKYSKDKGILLEKFKCIYKVSEAEIAMQKQKGYRVDAKPYFVMRLMQHSSNKAEVRKKALETKSQKGFTPTLENFKKYNSETSKAVVRINKFGIPTKYYSSMNHAAKDLGINRSGIVGAIKRNGTAGGYKWKLI